MMKRLVCLVLVILMFAGMGVFATAEEFSIRKGIQFGDSIDTVKKLEELKIESEDDEGSGIIKLTTIRGNTAGIDGEIFYIFQDNKLKDIAYYYTGFEGQGGYRFENDCKADYDSLYGGLVKKYGKTSNASETSYKGYAISHYEDRQKTWSQFGIPNDIIMGCDEWDVEYENYSVKIDLMYYCSGLKDPTPYEIMLSYSVYTNEDLTKEQEKLEKQEAIRDGDL